MTAYVVVLVGNEIDGRLTSVKLEKAFKTREEADAYMRQGKNSYMDEIAFDDQKIRMFCERNIQEVQLED